MYNPASNKVIPQRTWMPLPAGNSTDLACLKSLDTVTVSETMNVSKGNNYWVIKRAKLFLDCETGTGVSSLADYDIKNEKNEEVFFVFEGMSCIT